MASSRRIAFRLVAVLLAVLVLGNECAGVSAKRQTRKEKSQVDEPTGNISRRKLPPPTDLKVEVSCDNMYKATWNYDFKNSFDGFNGTLCSKDECSTTHIDYKDRKFSWPLPSPNSSYNFTLYAYDSDGRQSDSAVAEFTSFPKPPYVIGLTVKATSPTELKVIWSGNWVYVIELSACSATTSCVSATVPAQNKTHTFSGLEPGTRYEVTAQAAVTMNNRTCKGDAAKQSGTTQHLDPPTDLQVTVFCNNTLTATWAYNDEVVISGFNASLCNEDGTRCLNKTYQSYVRDLSYEHLNQNSSYTLFLYATFYDSRSKPAKESFNSFPNIPRVQGLTVKPISSSELEVLWLIQWEQNIELSACSKTATCVNATVPAKDMTYTFKGLQPSTTYEVTAEIAVAMNNRTCEGDAAKKSGTTLQLDPPKDLQVKVFCNNTLKANWEYSEDFNISGFLASFCREDGSQCNNETYGSHVRGLSYEPLYLNSSYTLYLYAFVSESLSDPANASFHSFPYLPHVGSLTVKATSPTELKVLWLSDWEQDVELSACSKTAPCVNATVPARNQTHTFKGLEPSTTYEVTAETVVTMNNHTCKGDAEEESGTTLQLEPPTNLSVDVSCGNQAQVNWTYEDLESINGFVVTLCHGSEAKCENKTLSKYQMECSFQLQEYNATYNVSVRSFHDNTRKNKTYSKPVDESLTSFPELPELDDIAVTGVSENALLATSTTEWDGEIAFYICSMPEECQNHTILGTPRKHTFEGLASNTTYRIRAQSQATLQKKECRGHLQERSASTFTKRPGEVRNVHHTVENGTILQASWELSEASNASGFTVKCEDPETKYTESRDVFDRTPPYHVTVVLQESVANFNCSLFAFNINATGGRLDGPAYNFNVATDGIASPENLTLVERNATSFTLSWSVDPNATKCEVTVTPEGGFNEELEKLESSCDHDKPQNGTVTHTVTALHPWTRYNVSVKNCRETFCGLPAFLRNITEVAAPSEVRNFSHTIKKDVSALLTWEKPEQPNGPISGYVIQVYNEDHNKTSVVKADGDVTEKEINLKDQFNLFNVSISAYNVAETSNQTIYGPESEIQFETLGKGPLPPRPKPQEVKEDSVHLSWEEPQDPRYNITGFSIKVNDQPPKEINQSSYTIEHLQPWTEYNVSVASCTNKTSCGQWRHLELKTDFGAPSAPLDLKAPEAGTHWMELQWEKPKVLNGPLSGYNVTFSHGSSHLFAVTTNVTYNFTDLVPGTLYDVSVYAFNEVKPVTKRGPPTSLQASTQADTPSGNGASAAVIAVAVIIPLIFIILIAAYFLYKKFQKRTGERTPLRSAEGM